MQNSDHPGHAQDDLNFAQFAHPGNVLDLCSALLHSIISNDSVSGHSQSLIWPSLHCGHVFSSCKSNYSVYRYMYIQ